ncbi:MotA/TolQ/ExbB proton channel family protein [Agarivorans aestuarii]|uniref:MotA/TolQ/ExbB proton channel family protein n=1 Tax=Agarivorans aestuarii TaxID=1563703 RepID=A0ABU7G0R4_9ALTE|nr:MotA/TolQ/ExbB proton channel family protein [Agarivorans aestuarii]MEE1673003.1 MotA/TolQ/ExbB proton channel family protein [Agarivorans aestuarii]
MLLEIINQFPDWANINEFMLRGGPVLWALVAVVACFWLLCLERVLFIAWDFPRLQLAWTSRWDARSEQHSWLALWQRNAWLSEAENALKRHFNILKLLVALCPMLGLLGTVTGMIVVFDTMANQGNADPRLMAAGIARATLPTMAGMVAALTSMFVYSRLLRFSQRKQFHLERLLRSRR